MPITIYIPTPLRPYTDRQATVSVEGATVDEALNNLTSRYGEIAQHLFTDEHALRSYVNVYVNDRDIRYLQKGNTQLHENDTMSIVPSIAGGADTAALDKDEVLRYSRHLIIPEIGMEGQKLLKQARVLIVGAGGLGSPVALYLAAAGVGTLGIVDFDVVDASNLQRQILHGTDDVGKPKLDSARRAIQRLNPHVGVETHQVQLTSENAFDILSRYDIVVDGTDNFATRYLVNDACVLLNKPNVYGSIFRFDGQVTVFDAQRGPCYRCLYPAPPPPGLIPSCAEGGVLGVLPGIVGTLQALETIKLIVGKGDLLVGRLVLFDALAFSFRELALEKNPECPICGKTPTIHELIDYEQFCGIQPPAVAVSAEDEEEISVSSLKSRLEKGEKPELLDVREPQEYAIVNLGAPLIPLGSLPQRYRELDPGREIVVYCKSGVRSAKAVAFLRKHGYNKAKNLAGGIDAWARDVDRSLPRY